MGKNPWPKRKLLHEVKVHIGDLGNIQFRAGLQFELLCRSFGVVIFGRSSSPVPSWAELSNQWMAMMKLSTKMLLLFFLLRLVTF